jgi:hypothetical protein
MEQERRDHELALRLAAESRGGVIEEMVVKRADSIGGRLGKNPFFLTQPSGFFWVSWVSWFFFVFFLFFLGFLGFIIYLPRSFLGFFQFQEYF